MLLRHHLILDSIRYEIKKKIIQKAFKMTTATIGSRFQVVIPANERKQLALKAHQKVLIEQRNDEIVIRPLGGRSFRGITKVLQVKEDPVDYIANLRAEWDQRS